MELAVEEEYSTDYDGNFYRVPYTVHVDDHRILSLATDCPKIAAKWLKSVLKSHSNKFGSLLVGVNVERRFELFKHDNGPDGPYDLLELCIGSHCLIYNFQSSWRRYGKVIDNRNLKCFADFFSASHVIAVGVDMAAVAKNLEKHNGIKFANPTDLNEMAVKGVKREDLDLANYDVDRLATAVLGKEYWIERPPEEEVEWFCGDCERYRRYPDNVFMNEKVMYATFECYFVYLIGSKLLEMLNGDFGIGSGKKSKKKKKKKRGH